MVEQAEESRQQHEPAPVGHPGTAVSAAWSEAELPAFGRLHDAAPHARVLSNGSYWTLVTSAGAGTSQCGWFAVTRWNADRICDEDGVLVYLRDLDSGEFWSLGATPMGSSGGTTNARATPGCVTIGRR